ncbi:hypothetical protein IVA80_10925 [Bradyrhizobium sp. 139]|uniref:hypothetical protein n=1 Tax=Bradyrhizobium sp. 139 TaxID=2782616 RepID=UPI001FF74DF9|nr:hypothetical protein [Bradyrhizobium sp. 139]MCK1741363.1 hypothetical protein [Bradyrhizobium sp. 139]
MNDLKSRLAVIATLPQPAAFDALQDLVKADTALILDKDVVALLNTRPFLDEASKRVPV